MAQILRNLHIIELADAQTSGSSQAFFLVQSVAHAACNLLKGKGLLSTFAELFSCKYE